jgi:hypothetical protein
MKPFKLTHAATSGMGRVIDEIAFQASLLTLNAAVAAAADPSKASWSAQASRETLALIEESIGGSPVFVRAKLSGEARERGAREWRGCGDGGVAPPHPMRRASRGNEETV